MAPPTRTLTHHGPSARADPATAPFLFLAFHCDRPLAATSRHSLAEVDLVTVGRGGDLAATRGVAGGARRLLITVPDGWMSSEHARFTSVGGAWVVIDAQSKNGTFVNGARVERAVLNDGDLIEVGHTLFIFRSALATPFANLGGALADADARSLAGPAPGLATLLLSLAAEFARLPAIARSRVPVVIRGATGTGKELVARAVHALSGRPGPLLALNCGSFAPELIAGELFGSRKGAFSGATEDRPGLIRSADQGTLFLDEIGDLPLALQTPFLRALQEGEVLPVGATRPVRVDFKLVCATHRDLAALVAEGRFRADLFARLSGLTVTLPPLAERREDLGLLVAALLGRLAGDRADRISFQLDAARLLFSHSWPLNIRELERCLGAANVLAEGRPIEVSDLPEELRAHRYQIAPPAAAKRPPTPLAPEDQRRRDELHELLTTHEGNIAAVARALGKARVQIQRWMTRYGLVREDFERR